MAIRLQKTVSAFMLEYKIAPRRQKIQGVAVPLEKPLNFVE